MDLQTTTIARLVAGVDELTAGVLARLRPDLSARIDSGTTPLVVFAMQPLRARVFAVAPNADMIEVADVSGADLPSDLDDALAAFLDRELHRLPTETQDNARAVIAAGGRLAILVRAFPFEARLTLFVSPSKSFALGTVTAHEAMH
jgi:hypothetical protein